LKVWEHSQDKYAKGKNKGATNVTPLFLINLRISNLVKVVLEQAVVYDSETDNAEYEIKNGIVLVLDALSCTALSELLLSEIESNEGEEQAENDLENTAVSGILECNSFTSHHNSPVNAVNTASNDRENKCGNDVALLDNHVSTSYINFYSLYHASIFFAIVYSKNVDICHQLSIKI